MKPFESIQSLVALRISRAYKTVSNDAINVIANLIPVDLWLKERATESFLTRLYNKRLELSVFPRIWKESVVKIIPKHEKDDYRDPNSYRPLSLLPDFAKILEKLLINRVVYYLRKKD
jgi:hypothetical protein